MTLENMIKQLADGPAILERQRFQITDPETGWTATLSADRRDDLTSVLWEVQLAGTTPVAKDLRTWGERIADRVTSLLEPLKLLELDAARNEAVLRSETPTKRHDRLAYHELFLQGTTRATLRRYAAPAMGGPRQQTSFALTHEALAKFVRDLVSK